MTPSRIFNWLMVMPIVFGIASIAFVLYSFFWPLTPAWVPGDPSTYSVSSSSGHVQVKGTYCINRPVLLTVNRELMRMPLQGKTDMRVVLPQTVQLYEVGCRTTERLVDLPEATPPGLYKLSIIVNWRANVFREEAYKLPDLFVEIKK